MGKKKKIVIIVVLVLILCLIFVSILMGENKSNDIFSQKQNTSISPIAQEYPSIYPTYPQFRSLSDELLPPAPDNWVLGDNPSYTINFPPDWQPEVSTVVGDGTNVTILPKSSDYYPVFVIEEAKTNPNATIEDRIKTLRGFTPTNYSEKNIIFRGQKAVQVSEVLPIFDHKGNELDKNYIFFTKDDKTFIATFAYIQDDNADINRLTLLQILSSIKLK